MDDLPFLLIAQTGIVKSMIGWVLVLLCLFLGLLVVCRPNKRKAADADKK
jgi:hypothetical protein